MGYAAVTGKKIRKNAVTSPKVKDFSLRAKDFRAGELPKGEPGPPGPTFGTAKMGSPTLPASDPPGATDEPSSAATGLGRHFEFTLPASGNVYIRLFVSNFAVTCDSGIPTAGLYLDGAPVPSTARPVVAGPADLVVVQALAAGPHSVESRWDCPGAASSTGYTINAVPTWTVFLLGS